MQGSVVWPPGGQNSEGRILAENNAYWEAVSVCFPATGIQSVMQGHDLRRLQLMGAPMLKVHHSTQKEKKW